MKLCESELNTLSNITHNLINRVILHNRMMNS
jgi:hypothetical protein